MDLFNEMALRLKQELKMRTDKEVAEALGLSQRAWVGRKKNGGFPETEVLALKSLRPELNLDVDYIFTGIRSGQYEANIKKAAQNPLSTDAERIAGMYAMLSVRSQKCLMETAIRLRELEIYARQSGFEP